jgi:hypothetical protein
MSLTIPTKAFLAHRLYGVKPWHHLGIYRIGTGWHCIELASWSLEVESEPLTWGMVKGLALGAVSWAVPALAKAGVVVWAWSALGPRLMG